MQDFLQQLDQNYYRSALLLVVRAEVVHLRQESSAGVDVESGRKTPLGTVPTADRTASPESSNCEPPLRWCRRRASINKAGLSAD